MNCLLIPLYIYPAPGAWKPLEDAIATHPNITFTIIINPGNGPGPSPLPDANYTREIPRLTRYANARVLGYVATTYARRDISLVRREIATYAAWPTTSSIPGLAVQGIFFDETPQQFSADAVMYLAELGGVVRTTWKSGYVCMIIHNPGAIPDSRYLSMADCTIVFEATYDTFLERHAAGLFAAIARDPRAQLGVLVHSVPDTVQGAQLHDLVAQVCRVADQVFITHLAVDYYAGFGGHWEEVLSGTAFD
ncbi:hypothetical protein ASPZODRAFT_61882 [Penicilliopsis zonata CBS 506.65]|uniref:Cell surface spherulin 4-like protein n=1 Tax=Penicilliopsis zonata CBS 506.65 TaxID=1073090 RepID=A0A1L9SMC7_9EURO|nr:hypothetical protein ASPZODRAFT_61882 [Penicilliopsis zonata CBS 506.65]OJJ48197.1 hypothetical protein ASPZODRAFT_61882 [Penicilliopsis zonata CBS 506.65]